MKYTVLYLMVFCGCTSRTRQSATEFLPGVYVRAINHEFARGSDTLVVTLLDAGTATYSIVKKAGFEQFLNGKVIERKNTRDKFIVMYDDATGTFNDNHKMRSFRALPKQRILLSGSQEYHKVKQ